MADNKTLSTDVDVDAFLASKATPEQLMDSKRLIAMCERITGQAPRMWGPSIVGFGSYSYKYASGHTGEASLTGFAVRGKELVVYGIADGPEHVDLLARLGRHKMGKGCLYFKRLSDLNAQVLEALIAASVADLMRRFPQH